MVGFQGGHLGHLNDNAIDIKISGALSLYYHGEHERTTVVQTINSQDTRIALSQREVSHLSFHLKDKLINRKETTVDA